MTGRAEGLTAYIAVTAAYWAFMLTDGALRMLVLLHFHMLGFSPVQLAYLFVLYEFAGMVTNLCAGWIASRFGLATTLYAGLVMQIVALLALTQLDVAWGVTASVMFAMGVQGVSGIAKDLTNRQLGLNNELIHGRKRQQVPYLEGIVCADTHAQANFKSPWARNVHHNKATSLTQLLLLLITERTSLHFVGALARGT